MSSSVYSTRNLLSPECCPFRFKQERYCQRSRNITTTKNLTRHCWEQIGNIMTICNQLWHSSEAIIKKHLNHPFSRDLASGTLDKDIFRFYLQQDAIYILKYAEAMNLLADKAPTAELKRKFLKLSKDSYELEHIFQAQLFKDYQVEPSDTMQPACLAYTSYLIATISTNEFLIGLISLLPCFWVYLENGKNIARQSVNNNPYQSWVDTYMSEEFEQQTEMLKHYIEFYGKGVSKKTEKRMFEVFTSSCRLDYLFMDYAYKKVIWER